MKKMCSMMFAAIAAAGMLFAMGGQAEQGNGKPKHLTMYVGYVEEYGMKVAEEFEKG